MSLIIDQDKQIVSGIIGTLTEAEIAQDILNPNRVRLVPNKGSLIGSFLYSYYG